MVHSSKDGLFIDGDAGIFLDDVLNGIGNRCLTVNQHLNTVDIGDNAVHPQKLDCNVWFIIHDIIRRI